jgi:hypothetical protein
MDYSNLTCDQDIDENGLVFDLGSLYDFLKKVPDPRKQKGKRYSLAALLVMMLLAKLGGEDKPSGITDWVAERAEQLRHMKILVRDKPPCHMTYRRVLQEVVNVEEFEALIGQYKA